ncbi:MAG: hypothetical protein II540_04770 [Paludibacteraceae bacterium]|nr:hypothetical protein [Paludibacteraceae bacterium]
MCINAIAPHKHGLYQDCVFITATAQENRGREMRQAGHSQGVVPAGTAKGCSRPPEVVAATGR